MATPDVIVVGAGAMGASVAWHAARLGAGPVVLLDRAQPCSGTSARGAGLVNRLLWNPLDIALVNRSLHWLRVLEEDAGEAFTLHAPGGLLVVGPHQRRAAERSRRMWLAQGLAVARLEPDEVAELPGCDGLALAPEETGYFVEGDGWCVTTDAVTATVDAARALGVDVRPHATVEAVEEGGVRFGGGGWLSADHVVVAAGAWSGRLLTGAWQAPLLAYRPQAAALAFDQPAGQPTLHDAVHGTYWRPEGPGKLVVGNGTVLEPQDVGGEPPVEPDFAASVAGKLAARWPAAAEARLVRAWAGFEAGTPDRMPLAGPVPGLDGVHLLTGGNGFGFMRAFALGEAMAHQVLGEEGPVPIEAYRPSRFDGEGGAFELREGFSLG